MNKCSGLCHPMPISVVINTLNRAEELDRALRALKYQRYTRFEVIVVNGPSEDRTMEVLQKYPSVVTAICPLPNLSLSRNIGIEHARGHIICFLDDDAIPEPTWLERVSSAYRKDISGVGGYLLNNDGVSYQCRAVYCDEFGNARYFDSMADFESEATTHQYQFPSPTGANASFLRSALYEIGGFDEAFHYYLDETDICLRLARAGKVVTYTEGADVHHKYAASHLRSKERIPLTLYQFAKSKAYFVFRHAASRVSRQTITNEINIFMANIRNDVLSLFNRNKITHHHKDKLLTEIEQGCADGQELAKTFPRRGLEKKVATTSEIRQFKVIRPIARRRSYAAIGLKARARAGDDLAKRALSHIKILSEKGHEVHCFDFADQTFDTLDFQDAVWEHTLSTPRHKQRMKSQVFEAFADLKGTERAIVSNLLKEHFKFGFDRVFVAHTGIIEALARYNISATGFRECAENSELS